MSIQTLKTLKARKSAKAKPASSARPSTSPYSHNFLQLQQKLGNQAVQRLFQAGVVKAKLTIGAPNDKYEQEADRVSEQVMRMPDPTAQRMSEDQDRDELIQTKRLTNLITPLVQRQTELDIDEEVEEPIQAKFTTNPSSLVTTGLENQIRTLKGGGQPLPASERAFFEPRFGANFADVRVHTDNQAARTAESINARAFTIGRDIVFATGQFLPGTHSGRSLLAHELTHALQQSSESKGKHIDRKNISVLSSTKRIQRLTGAEIAGLGLAAFSTGKELATSGGLSHKSTPATYMHPGTPARVKWKKVITTLHLKAWNPRYLIGEQNFYFRLAYDYNGYDIRNATVNVLRSRSSGMYASTFDITWSPGKHSRPKDPVAQIVFNISGQWNPVGRGDVSFWGKLVISAAENGRNFESFKIGSEKGYKGTSVWRA
jgi:hypothetical protein